MVVLDSSALIPLAWVGELDLVSVTFDERRTSEHIRQELLVEGERGTAALDTFLEDVTIHETPPKATDVASMEGIALADASAVVLAAATDERLLANDRGLIEVGRSHGVECWWLTTVLLSCAKDGNLSGDDATEILYDLVDAGMYLHPKVYARVERALRELGD